MDPKKDKMKFAQVMAALGEVFDSSKETSALKTEIYFKALAALSIEEIEKAAVSIIQTRTVASFPKPAEIIQCVRGTEEQQGDRAWVLVDEAMRKYGNYNSLNFGDRRLHRCIEIMGGWEYLGLLDEKEWKWKRKEFGSLYASLPVNEGQEYVPGVSERSNLAKGFDAEPVLQIGNGKAAKMIEDPKYGGGSHEKATDQRQAD